MNFEELKQTTEAFLEKKKLDDATIYLEQIIARYPERQDIHTYKMLLAETYFKLGKYASSCQLYDHYQNYYPSDSKAEYAQYQAILAQFYQTLKTDCDQTPTEETIKLCTRYLNQEAYQKYRKDILDIQNTCEHKLISKEIYVFNFYLKQGKYEAAQNRLNYLKNHYLVKKKLLEPQLLYLETKLAKKQKNDFLVNKNVETLSSQYPESQYAKMSYLLANKKDEFEFV